MVNKDCRKNVGQTRGATGKVLRRILPIDLKIDAKCCNLRQMNYLRSFKTSENFSEEAINQSVGFC